MMKMQTLILFVLFSVTTNIFAQDTLPDFTVKNVGSNRIILSWVNNFENVKQISIQRSSDSLTNYKSIHTVAEPMLPQNGFMDTHADYERIFYRLYVQMDKGVFLFSNPKRPVMDTVRKNETSVKADSIRKLDISGKLDKFPGPDSIYVPSTGINTKTRPEVFTASMHVYTQKDGYVRINLPIDEEKNYSIKFFEDDGSPIFELKEIKERTFKIDKANFYHSGWFRFELYEKNKLIEKHKFFLEKEF